MKNPKTRWFAVQFPNKAAEFVRNLDNPDKPLAVLASNSRDLCEWHCLCGKNFEARAAYRTGTADIAGCRKCRKSHQAVRAMRQTASRLIDEHPEIAKQFIRVIGKPGVKVEQVSSGSNQMAKWNCNCGATFERKVNRVVSRNSIFCKDCSHTGKSLFELEVAELLRAATGVNVETHHLRLANTDVDLYFPEIDTAVQLDPYWSHYRRYEQDVDVTAKLEAVYKRLIRIRQDTLPAIPGHTAPTVHSKDRNEWVTAVAKALDLNRNTLTAAQERAALEKASALWMRSAKNGRLDGSAADYTWHIEFVSNITHPGKKLEFSATKSEDVCEWKCSTADCGNTWQRAIYVRTRSDELGCDACQTRKKREARESNRQVTASRFRGKLSAQECKALWGQLFVGPRQRQSLAFLARQSQPVKVKALADHLGMTQNDAGAQRINLIKKGAIKSAGFGLVEFTSEDFRAYVASQQP